MCTKPTPEAIQEAFEKNIREQGYSAHYLGRDARGYFKDWVQASWESFQAGVRFVFAEKLE